MVEDGLRWSRRVKDLKLGVWGSGLGVHGYKGFGCKNLGSGFRVQGLEFGV